MDTFIGKLTQLTYELFGVLLPGFLCAVFVGSMWLALGPLALKWSLGLLPELRLSEIVSIDASLSSSTRIAALVLLGVACYFLGQVLNGVSRQCTGGKSPLPMTDILRFRLHRPTAQYRQELSRLFAVAAPQIVPGMASPPWDEFFRVARCLLVQNRRTSLAATYQSKYTLHRSIAIASAGACWVASLALVGALVTWCFDRSLQVNWILLLAAPFGFLISARQFARSYADNWTLFGDTIVTETYALIRAHEMGLTRENADR